MPIKIDENSKIIKKVPADSENEFGYVDVTTKDIDIKNSKKPTIIVFPGNGSIEKQVVNGYLSIIRDMIGLESANVYGVCYGHKAEHDIGNLTRNEYKEFYDNVLKPLCFDENGKPYEQKQISKNCRKVIFFSHCAGETVVNKFVNAMAQGLIKSGFDDEQTTEILEQLMHISYTPYMENDTYYGSRVEFCSLDDKMLSKTLHMRFNIDPQDEPYLGIAELIRDKNVLTVLSNSFGNIFYMDTIDDHNISTIELDKNGLPALHKRSARTIAISYAMAALLSFGVLSKNFDLDTAREILETEFNSQQGTFFEKKQEEVFQLRKQGGQPLREYMKQHNITEKDVIDGNVDFRDIVKPVMKNPYGQKIYPPINYESAGVKECFKADMHVSSDSQIIGDYKIEQKDLPYIIRNITSVVLKDGRCLTQNDNETVDDLFMHARLSGRNLDDCVRVDLRLDSLEEVEKNKLKVCLGKRFKRKSYETFNELKKQQIPSGEDGVELSEEQTRVVLNYAHRFSVPFGQIVLENDLKLNRRVMFREVNINEQGLVSRATPYRSEQKATPKVA